MDEVLARLAQVIPLSPEDLERTRREMDRRSAFVPIVVADWLRWEDFRRWR